MAVSKTMTLAGRTLQIDTGHVAEQANGAVTITYGETVVLVTAVASPQPREGIDFFPLTVDYEERMYAAGKIPGGFLKREGRPSQEAILTMRLTDRPLRPLFPKGFRNDVQIVATVFSTDQENEPPIQVIIGASAALSISDIPFGGPVGAVRMGYIDGQHVVNPLASDVAEKSRLDMVVAGTKDAIVMVEAGAKEVSEEVILESLQLAHEEIKRIIALQEELVAEAGKPKRPWEPAPTDEEMVREIEAAIGDRLREAANNADKSAREAALSALHRDLAEQFAGRYEAGQIAKIFESLLKKFVRKQILEEGVRPDGRRTDEVRPISCQVGVLPRVHGSGMFKRGQTQVLSIVTLGTLGDEQLIDGLGLEESRRYMHHYNFPPYSTGETKRMGSPGRREIGHGALAERALEAVIPPETTFPYTIRVVSEVLSSNGSTSMGSVCGSTLALMDAGVPIKAPVSGVAMGLITDDSGRYAILTDIQGIEDALGDMDFKVAGTEAGVTAIQMDMKIQGLSFDTMREALDQAKSGRMFILGKMLEAIAEPRRELNTHAPRIIKIQVHPDKIRVIIGPGGKTIRSIVEQTKAKIDVEDDGTVLIATNNEDSAKAAIQMIEALTKEVEVGQIYLGKVTRLMNFGAFVEILPGKEGLVHISELAEGRVERVEDAVQIGDQINVMVTEIDRMGRINLSRRAVLVGDQEDGEAAPAGTPAGRPLRDAGPREGGPRGDRGGPRPGGRPGSPGGRGPGGGDFRSNGGDRDPRPGGPGGAPRRGSGPVGRG
ncbi:MAG TPA: polyribonucleotide nucleotidyltransferase [Dehalococcoidia bacterium]|nr:polyribonucleotide nucleotidyltransferase [Dehalococcoidia bacterium]